MARKMVLISEAELKELKEDKPPAAVYKSGDVQIRIEDDKKEPNSAENQVLELLAPRLQKRARRILMHLIHFPQMFRLGESGEFFINNQPVIGGNFVDILSELLVNIRKKKFDPAGINDFIRVLANTKFPETLIVNTGRRKQLRKTKLAIPGLKRKMKRYY